VIRVRVIDQPLVSEQTFWSVQEALQNRRSEYTSRRIQVRQAFLFRGHLKCGICGMPMYAISGGKNAPRKDYYACRNKKAQPQSEGEKCPSCYLRRDLIDERVLDFISEKLSDPELIMHELRSIFERQQSSESEKRREELESRIDSLKRKREKLLDLYLKGVYSEEEISGKANEILEEKQRLERQLSSHGPKEEFDAEDYRQAAEDLALAFSEFKFWSRDSQREFLSLAGAVFYLDPEGITGFNLNFGAKGLVDKRGNRTHAGSPRADESNENPTSLPHAKHRKLEIKLQQPYPWIDPSLIELYLPDQEYFCVAEAARILNEHPSDVFHKIRKGVYPAGRKEKYRRLLSAEEIREMAALKIKYERGLSRNN
jgi:hypothetical protein